MKFPKLQENIFSNFLKKFGKRDEIILWILCVISAASLICAFQEEIFKAANLFFLLLEKLK